MSTGALSCLCDHHSSSAAYSFIHISNCLALGSSAANCEGGRSIVVVSLAPLLLARVPRHTFWRWRILPPVFLAFPPYYLVGQIQLKHKRQCCNCKRCSYSLVPIGRRETPHRLVLPYGGSSRREDAVGDQFARLDTSCSSSMTEWRMASSLTTLPFPTDTTTVPGTLASCESNLLRRPTVVVLWKSTCWCESRTCAFSKVEHSDPTIPLLLLLLLLVVRLPTTIAAQDLHAKERSKKREAKTNET